MHELKKYFSRLITICGLIAFLTAHFSCSDSNNKSNQSPPPVPKTLLFPKLKIAKADMLQYYNQQTTSGPHGECRKIIFQFRLDRMDVNRDDSMRLIGFPVNHQRIIMNNLSSLLLPKIYDANITFQPPNPIYFANLEFTKDAFLQLNFPTPGTKPDSLRLEPDFDLTTHFIKYNIFINDNKSMSTADGFLNPCPPAQAGL